MSHPVDENESGKEGRSAAHAFNEREKRIEEGRKSGGGEEKAKRFLEFFSVFKGSGMEDFFPR